jgi:hypothetical protein
LRAGTVTVAERIVVSSFVAVPVVVPAASA